MKAFAATAFSLAKMSRSKLLHLLAALSLAGLAAAASAQFPIKPITLVVPYQAGGSSDGMFRALAAAAAAELGQPVVVENKAGAEGQLGCLDVAKAPPDGYRLVAGGAGSLVLVPALRKSPPYDPVKDFTPIAGAVEFSFFLYVTPELPAKNLAEFVAYVKANPGKINYAIGNNIGLMSMGFLARTAGLDMVKVSYKGEMAAVTDMLTNRVQAMIATSAPLSYVKAGKLRALATTLTKRSKLLPDVPTMKEAGQQEVPFGGGWVAIFGPAGMPKEIVDRLSKAFIAANNRPDIHAKADQFGLVPSPLTPDQLGAYVKAQVIVYRDTVRDMKMPVE